MNQRASKGGEAFDVVKEYDILFLGDQRGDHKLAHEDALRHLEKLIREDAARSETGPSVPVADLDIIGCREKGDENKGRAWWSGGAWLRPGEVIAVLKLPSERPRGE